MDTEKEPILQPQCNPAPIARADAAGQLAQLTQSLKTQVEKFGRTMKEPDDIWPLLLFLLRPDGEPAILGISQRFMNDERSKKCLTEMAVELATEYHAVAMAFLCAGWQRPRALHVRLSAEPPAGPSPNGEILMIQEIHPASLGTHIAGVRRSATEPPSLSPWIQCERPVEGAAARFVQALQPVIAANFRALQP